MLHIFQPLLKHFTPPFPMFDKTTLNHPQMTPKINTNIISLFHDVSFRVSDIDLVPVPEVTVGFDCYHFNICTFQEIDGRQFNVPNQDPSIYVQCIVMRCPNGLVWDAVAETCDYPPTGGTFEPELESREEERPVDIVMRCPNGLVWDAVAETCDYPPTGGTSEPELGSTEETIPEDAFSSGFIFGST